MGRGARFALAAALTLLAVVSLSGVASANPISIVDLAIALSPVYIVLLNYPVNGLMLLAALDANLDEDHPRRHRDMRAFASELLCASFILTALGGFIDAGTLAAAASREGALSSASVYIIGLIVIFWSCFLISWRYLWMQWRPAMLTSVLVTFINAGGWFIWMFMGLFLFGGIAGIAFTVALWASFAFALRVVGRKVLDTDPDRHPEQRARYGRQGGGLPASFRQPISEGQADSIRAEARTVALSLVVLTAIFAVMLRIAY